MFFPLLSHFDTPSHVLSIPNTFSMIIIVHFQFSSLFFSINISKTHNQRTRKQEYLNLKFICASESKISMLE